MGYSVETKRWSTTYETSIVYYTFYYRYESDIIECRISMENPYEDNYSIKIPLNGNEVPFDYTFKNNVRTFGTMKTMPVSYYNSYKKIIVWGNIKTGISSYQHFEGTMVEMIVENNYVPPPPVIHVDKDETSESIHDVYISDPEPGDLFPFVYMRKWPEITQTEEYKNFVTYHELNTSPPSSSLYLDLVKIKSSGTNDARIKMEDLSLAYINGETDYLARYVASTKFLLGSIKQFPEIYDKIDVLKNPDRSEVILITCSLLCLTETELAEYIQSYEFKFELERVWESYFALNIYLGYEEVNLLKFTKIILISSLLDKLFSNPKLNHVYDFINANIILPETVFPLPPLLYSPPPVRDNQGWIEPYAIGELQLVQKKLKGYSHGDLAHIENILKGEKKERKILKRQKQENTQETEELILNKTTRDDREEQKDSFSETLKSIEDTITTTSYSNFQTSYGPPTTATLDGSWSVEQSPKTEKPSKKDISEFAKSIINKGIDLYSKQIKEFQTQKIIEENIEENKSTYDNRNGDKNIQAVYRWLNKIYKAELVNYGNRFMIEFIVEKPAEEYLKSLYHYGGDTLIEPCSPESIGIHNFNDITDENYLEFASIYKLYNLDPPPEKFKYRNAVLNANEKEKIKLPDAYQSQLVYLKTNVKDNFQILIGQQLINTTTLKDYYSLDHEGDTISAAFSVDMTLASPPYNEQSYYLSIDILCERTETLYQKWKLSVYREILKRYEQEKKEYYNKIDPLKKLPQYNAPSQVLREIERKSLKEDAVRLLFQLQTEITGKQFHINPNTGPNKQFLSETAYLQFFDEIFEWGEMAYSFSRNLNQGINSKEKYWSNLSESQINDDLFASFLQADIARLLVPVRPQSSLAALYYFSSGRAWTLGNSFCPVDNKSISIALDLKQVFQNNEIKQSVVCEEWEITIPTTLQVIDSSFSFLKEEE